MGNLILLSGLSLPRNLGTRLLMNTLAFIVSLLYSLVGIVFQVVFAVANLDNISMFEEAYQKMQDRFYIIIGIVMLFKVSMSMITYFANPDKLTDKEAGMGKVVTRMIIVLILLIFVPSFVFPFLSRIQQPLLNTVGRVVMQTDGGLDHNTAHMYGQQMATVLLGGFFTLRDESCGDEAAELGENIFDAITNLSDEECSGDKKTFKYDFDFVGALLAIVPILVISLIIGVQVAIRAFKLIILKLLAPIPIIYYMDPKSMKDGGKTSAYIKLFISTYIDLFIHFGALFFVVELINIITTAWAKGNLLLGTLQLAAKTGIIGLVFVIIGLLLFAFQAPKFVKKALGLKDSEFGSGLAGLLTTGAAMAGAVGSGVAAFGATAKAGGNFIQNFGAAASSAIRGGQAGYKAAGDKGDFSKVLSGIRAKNAEMAADRTAGVTFGVRAKELFGSTFMGIGPGAAKKVNVDDWDSITKDYDGYSAAEKKEATKGKYDAVSMGTNAYMSRLGFTSGISHYDSSKGRTVDYSAMTGKSKDLRGVVDQAKAAGNTEFNFGGMTNISVSEGDYLISEMEKREQAVFRDKLESGDAFYNAGNANLLAELESIQQKIDRADLSDIRGVDDRIKDGFKNMDDQMKLVKAESIRTKNDTEYIAAVAASKKNK